MEQDIRTSHVTQNSYRFRYLFFTVSPVAAVARKHSRLFTFEEKMAAAQLRINLRDLHAAMQSAADCCAFLHRNGLLAVHMAWPKSNGPMEESEYQRVTDRVTWRCKPKNCRTIASIRKGSFFESAHLPLSTLIDMVYYWSIELPHTTTK